MITKNESMINNLMTATLNRRRAIIGAGVATAAVALPITFSTAAAQMGATPMDATPVDVPFDSPIDVLNFALTLEHIEAAFYRDGLAAIGREGITEWGFQDVVFDNLALIGEHEAEHVLVLTQVITELGGQPVMEATYDFGYEDAIGFVQVAQALEDTGVAAYQGAAQYLIDSDELLTAALTIHGVEARHASYVALLNSAVPFPDAFNPTLTPGEVLEIATPFIVQ